VRRFVLISDSPGHVSASTFFWVVPTESDFSTVIARLVVFEGPPEMSFALLRDHALAGKAGDCTALKTGDLCLPFTHGGPPPRRSRARFRSFAEWG
jgi:hypothetical protein